MTENGETKVCKRCAETIKAAAKMCPYCGGILSQMENLKIICVMYFFALCLGGASICFKNTTIQFESFAEHHGEITVLDFHSYVLQSSNGNSVFLIGTLTNSGLIPWDNVKLRAEFLDKAGRVVHTIPAGYFGSYDSVIMPRSISSFKISNKVSNAQMEYATCNASVVEADDIRQFFLFDLLFDWK